MKGDRRPVPDGGTERARIDVDAPPERTWEVGADPPLPPDPAAARELLAALDWPAVGEEPTVLRVVLGDESPATLDTVTGSIESEPSVTGTSIGTDAGPERTDAFDALLAPQRNPVVTAAALWTTRGVGGVAFATFARSGPAAADGVAAGDDNPPAAFAELQEEVSQVSYEDLVTELERTDVGAPGEGVDALVDPDPVGPVRPTDGGAPGAVGEDPDEGGDEGPADGGDDGAFETGDDGPVGGADGGPTDAETDGRPPAESADEAPAETDDGAADGDAPATIDLTFPDEETARNVAEAVEWFGTEPSGATPDADAAADDATSGAGETERVPGDLSPDEAFERLLAAVEAADPEQRERLRDALGADRTADRPRSELVADLAGLRQRSAELATELAALEHRLDAESEDAAAAVADLRDRQDALAAATAEATAALEARLAALEADVAPLLALYGRVTAALEGS
jgi:hypothetical protein